MSGTARHHRRSSTNRSIGNRSDLANSANGDVEEIRSGLGIFAPETEERQRERLEADKHVATYVTDQLERIRSDEGSAGVNEDEFEAQLDD